MDALRLGLGLAEMVAVDLNQANWALARLLLAPGSDAPSARQPAREAVEPLAARLDPRPAYWPALEPIFKRYLVDLAQDRSEGEDGMVYGVASTRDWAADLRRAGLAAFQQSINGLDGSGGR